MEHQYHRELKSQVSKFLRDNGYETREEFVLPNNKIADVFGMSGSGKILIVEVKTTLSKCSLTNVMEKYSNECDGLYVAGDSEDIEYMLLGTQLLDWTPFTGRIGLIGMKNGKCTVVRQAIPRLAQSAFRHWASEALKGNDTAGRGQPSRSGDAP